MKIHSLFILKTSGVCLYSRNFTNELEKVQANLITPFFSALFSFSENVISRKIEELEMADLRFVFKVFRKEFIFVLLADSSVSLLFLKSRIQQIRKVFLKLYDELGLMKDYKEIENEEFDDLIESIITGEEDIFQSHGLYLKVIEYFRELIFQNEIVGAALLSTKGNIIYSSLPSEILLSSLRELEIRFMSGAMQLPQLFYSLENGQKVVSGMISDKKQDVTFLAVLLFESTVPFGMAEVFLYKVTKNIKILL